MIKHALSVWLSCLVVWSLAACSKEITWLPATQVIVTVRSDLGDELRSVEASIYDVRGEELGGQHLFQLNGSRSLPLSFSVVPRTAQSNQFLVVLSGRDAAGQELLQTRAIVSFVERTSVGVQLWLYAGCKGLMCQADQTCTATDDQNRVSCTSVPVLESVPVVPGEELDATTGQAPPPSDEGGLEPDAAGDASTDGAPQPVPDAGADTAVDAQGDTGEPPPPGVCAASAGQALCSDNLLIDCNTQGEVATQETCVNARQCQLGLARRKCADCEPGVYRCTGARLDRCAQDGLAWSEVKTCASEVLCNVQAGDCTANACTASTRTCMGDDLYGCNQDLTALVKREECDAGMCDQAQGQCDVCTPSSRTCQQDSVAQCDMDGQNLSVTSCPASTPKCTGNGQCVQCTAASHCPAPTNPCQSATCTGTPPRCGTVNRPAPQPCAGGVCNGTGTCVQCVTAAECPTGKKVCTSANKCVQCQVAGDCAQGYECRLSDNTCQRVSIAGTATGCSSYGAASSGKCAGYYCNVTSTQLSAAFDPTAVCGGLTAAGLCAGTLGQHMGSCAREVKSADTLQNPQSPSPNSVLRPKVEACVRGKASYAAVSSQCMECYLDVEQCAWDKCLIDCLTGNSAGCDGCRMRNNCNQPLPGCSGLPNSF